MISLVPALDLHLDLVFEFALELPVPDLTGLNYELKPDLAFSLPRSTELRELKSFPYFRHF